MSGLEPPTFHPEILTFFVPPDTLITLRAGTTRANNSVLLFVGLRLLRTPAGDELQNISEVTLHADLVPGGLWMVAARRMSMVVLFLGGEEEEMRIPTPWVHEPAQFGHFPR